MNAAADVPPPAMHDLGDGFHAYVQLDGSWGLNNCGVYVGKESTFLVDTVFTERRAYALAAAVEELTDNQVHTIVNTHHHGDHVYGNFAFPHAKAIASRRCREAVIATGMETKIWFPTADFGNITLVPPSITFEDHVEVFCDEHRAQVRATSTPAHTDNDAYVWIAELGLLFTGDLVFHGGTPFVLMGSIDGLKRTLAELAELDIRQVVPGHGALCGPEVLADQVEYLDFVQQLASKAYRAGTEPLAAAREADLGRFAAWTDSERLVGNLHRAFSELREEPPAVPLDYHTIVDEMVAYKGGESLHSFA